MNIKIINEKFANTNFLDSEEVNELIIANKVMVDSLVKLRDLDFVISLPDRLTIVREISGSALKEIGF